VAEHVVSGYDEAKRAVGFSDKAERIVSFYDKAEQGFGKTDGDSK
jgi:hypothetical protein